MRFRSSRAVGIAAAIVAYVVAPPSPARGQDPESLTSALDSLLDIPVSTASKFAQTSREAAASVTVVTSEEIRRQGYRTVAEALETVPGFYLSDNHTYQALGVRGFGPLYGDNNRVLLLVDGHAANENFLDSFQIGTGLELDLSLLDRIEIVRGPGSALYGSNAMLAVVNLVTKSGRAIDGIQVRGEAGSHGVRTGSVLFGTQLESGVDLRVSGTWQEADGPDLYFPVWDTPLTNGGVVSGADWDEGKGLFASIDYRGMRMTAYYADRAKGIPTAPLGSDFGDTRAQSMDTRFFGELSLQRDLAPGRRINLRGYYDGSEFGVLYPYASTGDLGGETSGRWLGAEGQFVWDLNPAYRVTAGVEARRNIRAKIGGADPVLGIATGNFKSTIASAYGQGDLQLDENLHLTVGLRLDHYSTVGAALSPRGGLVYQVGAGTTLKALYGEAFRAPTQAELNLDVPPILMRNPDIGPERIRTTEFVWEQRLGRAVYTTASLYDYHLTDIISTTTDSVSGALGFRNAGRSSARGVEISVDASPTSELSLRAAYAFQSPERDDAERVQNAPTHTLRAGALASMIPFVELGIRGTFDSSRFGRGGLGRTDGYFVTDLTVATRGLGRVRASLIGRNVFNAAYTHPAGPEFLQTEHPQDGRTVTVRLDLDL